MVKRYTHSDPVSWLAYFVNLRGERDVSLLKKAMELCGSHLEKSLGISGILLELDLDSEGLAASIMAPAFEANEIHLETITDRFGENMAKLLRDISQLGALSKLQHLQARHPHQLEQVRKMLLGMVADVRAVLIVLAERLFLLRQGVTEAFANETLSIYAPLANRLGLGQLKWEMEDLCLRYSQPAVYKKIAQWLSVRREDRENYIAQVINTLEAMLKKAAIPECQVTGRVKHIYSIYKKMQRKKNNLDDIYDISAVRVLVPSVDYCYTVLGLVHQAWEQIFKEFDDYIMHPKSNGYQSIHTAVIGPQGHTVEVQIRTVEMHSQAELGVAAHWRYKEGGVQASSYEAKIAWLRQVMEWQKEITPVQDVFADRVYVFTPNGDIIDLPQGATPLDFAYYVHSEVGHRCKGAKIDGHIVPLTYHLQTGECVDILTAKKPNPSRDWLSPHSGYLKTPRARAKVQAWFRAQELRENPDVMSDKIIVDKIISDKNKKTISKLITSPVSKKTRKTDIQILGVGRLLTQIAGCCKPVPGESIIGYITQGKGVSIHRLDCHNIAHTAENSKNRLIEVEWGEKTSDLYPVNLIVTAYDRHGLLRDITHFFAVDKINMLGIQSHTEKNRNEAHIYCSIEISSLGELEKIILKLKKIPNIIRVERS